jgi:hypothetical protein
LRAAVNAIAGDCYAGADPPATRRDRLRIQKRARTWQYRRRLPRDLHEVLGRRREFTRSLCTSMYRQACRRAALLDAQMERLFDVLRHHGVAAMESVDRLIRGVA